MKITHLQPFDFFHQLKPRTMWQYYNWFFLHFPSSLLFLIFLSHFIFFSSIPSFFCALLSFFCTIPSLYLGRDPRVPPQKNPLGTLSNLPAPSYMLLFPPIYFFPCHTSFALLYTPSPSI